MKNEQMKQLPANVYSHRLERHDLKLAPHFLIPLATVSDWPRNKQDGTGVSILSLQNFKLTRERLDQEIKKYF